MTAYYCVVCLHFIDASMRFMCVCANAKAETLHTDRKNVVVVALLVIKLFLNHSNETNTGLCSGCKLY